MHRKQRAATYAVVLILMLAALAAAETTRKDMHFKVGRRASISIVNQYGPISVKAGPGKRVMVTAILNSGKVEVDESKRGNRVSIISHLLEGADADSGRVGYEVVVPADASVTLHSMTGPLHVEKLRGDVSLEGSTAVVEVRDVTAGRIHIKTLNGPVTLTNVSDGYVEITSVSGDVALHAVNGTSVHVNSNTGKIHYDGDFGEAGQYSLTSHSGDIEAIAPSYASIEVVARSAQGRVENDFPLEPEHTSFVTHAGSAFAGTVGKAASSVKLLSFSGKIHLKKREQ
ncbi:MAG TPA: DUF4097 family beta strand repeat-containing protein [Terriglobales bacterium]|nr:DUF4097 family beta strand repeat-containing protein [Terriglobales bacterium]